MKKGASYRSISCKAQMCWVSSLYLDMLDMQDKAFHARQCLSSETRLGIYYKAGHVKQYLSGKTTTCFAMQDTAYI